MQELDAGPATLVVAVPDGYDRTTLGGVTAQVVNNVAALPTDVPAQEVTLSGAAVPDVPLDVSSQLRGGERTPAAGSAKASDEANARAALSDLARSAQLYAEEHGSMAGFADALTAEQGPAIRRQMAALTDTSAVARVSPGHCLSIEFATGHTTDTRC